MSEEIKVVQSKAYCRAERKQGRKEAEILKDETVMFDPVVLSGTPEVVSMSYGTTINLGNFESARIDVFRSMPFVPGADNANAAMEVCERWCEDKLNSEIKALQQRGMPDGKSKFA